MKTITVCIILIITASSNAQQEHSNQGTIQPSQNEYIRLSEIPFQNAVRAISTPPRDHVPIYEQQYDIPPPPRPQPVQNQNQPLYNPYNPTPTYQISSAYNTHITNAPTSFQYMALKDSPNELYNVLYHINPGSNQYQSDTFSQGNDYLQQSYSPHIINNNIANVPENIKIVPAYNHIQPYGQSNFKPSFQISPSSNIPLSSNNQYAPLISLSLYKNGKKNNLPRTHYASNIPSINGFVPSKYFPYTTPRKRSVLRKNYIIKSRFATDGIEYVNPM